MTVDVAAVRAEFPILSRQIDGKPLARARCKAGAKSAVARTVSP